MNGASKILTVSYGTFSCTLEGFDDPFNTMRAIAEYFRDLAAEDRYFGAEPPTPDATMLHRIAEREVQRRVEAKINENGVILRTGDAVSNPGPVSQPSELPPTQPQVVAAAAAAAEPAPMPEGVAAKLLRIRAAVANAGPAGLAPATAAVDAAPATVAEYIEDEHAEDVGGYAAEVFEADDQPVMAPAPSLQGDDEFEEDFAEDILPETSIVEDAEEEPVEAEVVATPAEAEVVAEAYIEDLDGDLDGEVAEGLADLVAVDDLGLIEPEIEAALIPADDAEEVSEPEMEDAATAETDLYDDNTSAEDLADLRILDGIAAELGQADDAEDDLEDVAAPDTAVVAGDRATIDADYDEDYELEAETADSSANDDFDAAFAEVVDDQAEADLDDTDLSLTSIEDPLSGAEASLDDADEPSVPSASDKVRRARARVIKIRRDETPAEQSVTAQEPVAKAKTALSAEAEAELRRELEALTAASEPSGDQAKSDDDTSGTDDDPRKMLDAAGEKAVSRLIEQTNEVMAVPENRRRLSAIAHLKAAVAATVADRFARGGAARKEPETAKLNPYREDLALVVKPQTPTESEEPQATPRPAPLVLVSEQRIDRPRPAAPGQGTTTLASVPKSPIRPRRVTAAVLAVDPNLELEDDEAEEDTDNIFSDARGFAEFAERLGVEGLAETLEAAAAYAVCVEGRPYFSRPQLMSQINALSESGDHSREDSLRTFGILLRQGRIQKIKRGQFALSEDSPIMLKARSFAG